MLKKISDVDRSKGFMEISPWVSNQMVQNNLDKSLNIVFLGLGQAGGRIAAEFARLGYTAFAMNSNEADMEEIKNRMKEVIALKSSAHVGTLRGAAKNAALGLEIAKENRDVIKQLITRDEIMNADFVYVTVGLGGGTGNGALPLVLNYLKQVRPTVPVINASTYGVIASLPSSEEHYSIRKNAFAGIAQIEKLRAQGEIGSILLVDNDKLMKDYYRKHPKGPSALDYSNVQVASNIYEVSLLNLLAGSKVFDQTELLDLLGQPGYLTISKKEVSAEGLQDADLTSFISSVFTDNEVLTSGHNLSNATRGAIVIIQPHAKTLTAEQRDMLEFRTKEVLQNAKVHSGIVTLNEVSERNGRDVAYVYALANLDDYPEKIAHMIQSAKEEEEQELQRQAERQRQQEHRQKLFDEANSVFTAASTTEKARAKSLEDLSDDFDLGSPTVKPKKASELRDDFEL